MDHPLEWTDGQTHATTSKNPEMTIVLVRSNGTRNPWRCFEALWDPGVGKGTEFLRKTDPLSNLTANAVINQAPLVQKTTFLDASGIFSIQYTLPESWKWKMAPWNNISLQYRQLTFHFQDYFKIFQGVYHSTALNTVGKYSVQCRHV